MRLSIFSCLLEFESCLVLICIDVLHQVIEEDGLQENARRVGDLLLQEMMSLREEFEIVGDVRGSGLMLGMELVKSKVSQVSSQLTCSGLPQNFSKSPVYFVCLRLELEQGLGQGLGLGPGRDGQTGGPGMLGQSWTMLHVAMKQLQV